ncbi:hypothetical protein P3T37_004339 [Kitasatospora sp. MAA4]|nr:hypothetical protein [Kitasatospora sp. MAA4]MDH6134930.1 hypothetical protein [Kitasatospora sp. MAA4]
MITAPRITRNGQPYTGPNGERPQPAQPAPGPYGRPPGTTGTPVTPSKP